MAKMRNNYLFPSLRRVAKKKPYGRIINVQVVEINGRRYERQFHATKGWRTYRLSV